MEQEQLIKQLFLTEALKFSQPNQPFWYTSGSFGPYYLNTHFLFGGQERAEAFLTELERARSYPEGMPSRLQRMIDIEIQSNPAFKDLIDRLLRLVLPLDFDLISGGERRDLYFSIPLATALQLKHVTILKDGRAYLSSPDFSQCRLLEANELSSQKILHVADLLTLASSYFRAWLPTIERLGAEISDTAVVVSRCQGGEEALGAQGISVHALLELNREFFDRAALDGHIAPASRDAALSFQSDPEAYMRTFLADHPDFLERSRARGGREAERVALFLKEHSELLA